MSPTQSIGRITLHAMPLSLLCLVGAGQEASVHPQGWDRLRNLDEEGNSQTVVKSMTSFHEVEAQWDAGVYQSAVPQSSATTSDVSQQVSRMQGP